MLHLNLKITNVAAKFLGSLPPTHCEKIVSTILSIKRKKPRRSRRLAGYSYRQCDVGRYQVTYDVVNGTPRIIFVGVG
jgi:mRNA-degrading endonuclease RelE of RelBE toxin-antitoxin system